MDAYDSDSSLSDVDAGTSTNVLLGYASTAATDDTFSQLGGEPTWLEPSQHASPTLAQCKVCSTPMALLLQLNGDLPERFPGHERRLYVWACRRKACRRKSGSIRATRGVRTTETSKPAAPKVEETNNTEASQDTRANLGSSLFGGSSGSQGGSNPFASTSTSSSNPFTVNGGNLFSSSTSPAANPFSSPPPVPASRSVLASKPPQTPTPETSSADTLTATFASKARITPAPTDTTPTTPSPPQATLPWPEPSQRPKPYHKYHLDADYEYLSDPPTTQSNSNSNSNYAALMDLDGPSGSGSGKGTSGEEEDNQLYASEHDQAFQHLADTLSQNPEQVLRYDFGGSPLLYSRSDSVGPIFTGAKHDSALGHSKVTTTGPPASRIPRCGRCGSLRVFELQLMPHAIEELEGDEDLATLLDEGMEWGTVIVGVCSKDCGSGDGSLDYVDEWVGVQWEEVVHRGRTK